MQLFERWFAVSPDDGSGVLELAYAAVAVTVLVALLARRLLARVARTLFARRAQARPRT